MTSPDNRVVENAFKYVFRDEVRDDFHRLWDRVTEQTIKIVGGDDRATTHTKEKIRTAVLVHLLHKKFREVAEIINNPPEEKP